MKKTLVELKLPSKIEDNSLVAYRSDGWTPVSKAVYLNDIYARHERFKKEIKELKDELSDAKTHIKMLDDEIVLLKMLLSHILGYKDMSQNEIERILGEEDHE